MYKGQLKSWKDDKGFGFIQSSELSQDTFIHISTLKAMSRKPKVGDFIYFQVGKQTDGKVKAINCRIEGVAAKSLKSKQRHTPRLLKKSSAPKSKNVLLLAVVIIGVFSYQRLSLAPTTSPVPQTMLSPSSPISATTSPVISISKYSCDGRQHCSQMILRSEAEFFTKHYPNTKMDGDNDGIPCENDSRF